MDEDDSSLQLRMELEATVKGALRTRRPLLHHLNDDSTWLLQIPRPRVKGTKKRTREYFNVLIDPWLAGGQSDVASWFSQQFHATESKVPSIAALEDLLRQQETLAQESGLISVTDEDEGSSLIDAIAICHEFTDHCHKDTLLEVNANVPVIATANAAKLVRSWKHFRTVETTPGFGGEQLDWTQTSLGILPEWLSISRIVTAGDALYYHSALLITFNNTLQPLDTSKAEGIIYTPHGIHAEDLQCMVDAQPQIHTLAFLHGLHDIALSKAQLNLGAHNGLKAQRLIKAKYWIGTHDEIKHGGGLVSWFLRRKVLTLQDALEHERTQQGSEAGEIDPGSLAGANWLTLENGESRVLD